MTPYATELVKKFRSIYGVMDAESEMARELIELNHYIIHLERIVHRLEKDRHRAFYRQMPYKHEQTSLYPDVPPADDDSWLETGKDTEQ
jgi:hypothetical protein